MTSASSLLDPDMLLRDRSRPRSASASAAPRPRSASAARGARAARRRRAPRARSRCPLPARARRSRARARAQHFGVGGEWARAGTSAARPSWAAFDKARVSAAARRARARRGRRGRALAAGPVYSRTSTTGAARARVGGDDAARARAVPHAARRDNAFTMAAANRSLRWPSVSHRGRRPAHQQPDRGVAWVDGLAAGDARAVCASARARGTLPDATRDRDGGGGVRAARASRYRRRLLL